MTLSGVQDGPHAVFIEYGLEFGIVKHNLAVNQRIGANEVNHNFAHLANLVVERHAGYDFLHGSLHFRVGGYGR